MPKKSNAIGEMLRVAREANGMSQGDLATRLNERTGGKYMHTTIGKIERGERAINLNEAVHLADILGIGWDNFFEKLRPRTAIDEVKRIVQAESATIESVEGDVLENIADTGRLLVKFEERFNNSEDAQEPAIKEMLKKLGEDIKNMRECYTSIALAGEKVKEVHDFHSTVNLCLQEGIDFYTMQDHLEEQREYQALGFDQEEPTYDEEE